MQAFLRPKTNFSSTAKARALHTLLFIQINGKFIKSYDSDDMIRRHSLRITANTSAGGKSMLISFLRTLLLYIVLVLTVRLMGKRQIGEMEPSEFVVTMLIANLAAIPMQDTAIPLLSGLVPILVILGVELILAVLSLRCIRIRSFFCGKPVVLMENGKIIEKNLQKTRVNLDELTMHLREKDIFDLTEVKYAILETNGQLSTLLYAKNRPASARDAGIRATETELPVTLISGGKVLDENLAIAKKDRAWLEAELKKNACTVHGTLLLTVDAAGKVYLVRREDVK